MDEEEEMCENCAYSAVRGRRTVKAYYSITVVFERLFCNSEISKVDATLCCI
ncbi:hypothetical protein [Catonella massiliensis]|uniref:Uncharacterized protein n=1 Tax=Catonella massiliensis TaxID=2799636 RepID=A0ABS1J077_9FIRM|nr:hypothetical protein [Catonella massiliensis]MBK5897534.1 hypothetical protein [Catonella massiliensis]